MEMKEEWLMPGAVVPVDAETTAALVAEIKRLIGIVGGMALNIQPAQQEPVEVKQIAEALRQVGLTLVRTNGGFRVMDLGQIEAQTTSPPIEATPLASQRSVKPWVGLTLEDKQRVLDSNFGGSRADCMDAADKILREKNA